VWNESAERNKGGAAWFRREGRRRRRRKEKAEEEEADEAAAAAVLRSAKSHTKTRRREGAKRTAVSHRATEAQRFTEICSGSLGKGRG
jgi:hypothetical protein